MIQATYASKLQLAYAQFQDDKVKDSLYQLADLIAHTPTRGEAYLLRAHIYRKSGKILLSVRDFLKAEQILGLHQEDLLAYAELNLELGQIDQAISLLERSADKEDFRWTLLRADADQALEQKDEALRKYHTLLTSKDLSKIAIQRIIRLVSKHLEFPQASNFLEDIPELGRDDDYWVVRGNVAANKAEWHEALQAWGNIINPTPQIVDAIHHAGMHFFEELYRQGKDKEIFYLFPKLFQPPGTEKVNAILIAAAIRQALNAFDGTSQAAKEALSILCRVEEYVIDKHCLNFNTFQALFLFSLGEYEQAWKILESLPIESLESTEVQMVKASCALQLGKIKVSGKLLATQGVGDDRVYRLMCTLFALKGDWQKAWELSSRISNQDYQRGIISAIYHQGRNEPELHAMGLRSDEILYYQAIGNAQAGNIDTAESLLESLLQTKDWVLHAKKLLGWIRLQQAKTAYKELSWSKALDRLTEAMALEAENESLSTVPENYAPHIFFLYLMTVDRESARKILETQEATAGLGNSDVCHNLANFFFTEGESHGKNEDWEAAIICWEKAIAFLSIALSHPCYLSEWILKRTQAYGVSFASSLTDKLRVQIVDFYDRTFIQKFEILSLSKNNSLFPRMSDLSLALRAELWGAQILVNMGGFVFYNGQPCTLYPGPIYVSLKKMENHFFEFYDSLPVKSGRDTDWASSENLETKLGKFHDRSQEDEEGISPETNEDLGKFYSPLRHAAVLDREGRMKEALNRLQESEPTFHPSSQQQKKSPTYQNFWGSESSSLSYRNPAFFRYPTPREFLTLLQNFKISLLIRLGEYYVASPDNQLPEAIQSWEKAIDLAEEAQIEKIQRKISEIAIGRASVLEANDLTMAIELLEEIEDICGNSEIQGKLASLYASEGIQARIEENWEVSLQRLRRARSFNKHSRSANINLINALREAVTCTFEKNPKKTNMLMKEALLIAEENCEHDPHNPEFQQIRDSLTLEFDAVSIALAGGPNLMARRKQKK